MHRCSLETSTCTKCLNEDLKGLILEETGADQESSVVALVFACIKQLKKFAKWDALPSETDTERLSHDLPSNANRPVHDGGQSTTQPLGFNLGYTINLNLPATSDPAVFNAIFRALKEHLLKSSHE